MNNYSNLINKHHHQAALFEAMLGLCKHLKTLRIWAVTAAVALVLSACGVDRVKTGTDLTAVGVKTLAVTGEGETVTLLQGGSRQLPLAVGLVEGTAMADLSFATSGDAVDLGVITASVTMDTTTGGLMLVLKASVSAKGDYPLDILISNKKTNKSALAHFTVAITTGEVVADAVVPAAQQTMTITTSSGQAFVVDKGSVASALGVKVVQATGASGSTQTRFVFDQDTTGKGVTVTLPNGTKVNSTQQTQSVMSLIKNKVMTAMSVVVGGTTTVEPYSVKDKGLGIEWQQGTTKAYFLTSAFGGYRLPPSSVLAATTCTSVTTDSGEQQCVVDLPVVETDASRLSSVVDASVAMSGASDPEPVLFIHGYAASSSAADGSTVGGGFDTWGHFPALVASTSGVGANKKKFVPFEFQWATNARFGDAAIDLAQAITLIYAKTGKKVHIVSHSFGGVLTRALLQKQVSAYDTHKATVDAAIAAIADVITLGAPHSGISANNNGDYFPGSSQKFPYGQQPLFSQTSLLASCYQISCYQLGKAMSTDSQLAQVQTTAGEVAASLFETKDQLPNVPVVSAIGLTRYKKADQTFADGDMVISYAGQRFLPSNTAKNNLYKKEKIGQALVYETILGSNASVGPGDLVNDYQNSARNFGYMHSNMQSSAGALSGVDGKAWGIATDGAVFSTVISTVNPGENKGQIRGVESAPASASCSGTDAAATCDHASFVLFRDVVADAKYCSLSSEGLCITTINGTSAGTGISIKGGASINVSGTLTGTALGDREIHVFDGSNKLGVATVNNLAVSSQLTWSFSSATTTLVQGAHSIVAKVFNTATQQYEGEGDSLAITVSYNVTLNFSNASPTVGESISLWISGAVDTIKQVVFGFSDGIANVIKYVTSGSSEGDKATVAFPSPGNKTISAAYLDQNGKFLGLDVFGSFPVSVPNNVVVTYAGIDFDGMFLTVKGKVLNWEQLDSTKASIEVWVPSSDFVAYTGDYYMSYSTTFSKNNGEWELSVTAPNFLYMDANRNSLYKYIQGFPVYTYKRYQPILSIKAHITMGGDAFLSPYRSVSIIKRIFELPATAWLYDINTTGLLVSPLDSNGNEIVGDLYCPYGEMSSLDCASSRAGTNNHLFKFVKIGSNGKPLAIQDRDYSVSGNEAEGTSWSCVQDEITGLMWEVKTADGGLRDASKLYTGYDISSSKVAYVESVNKMALCGTIEWRMPTDIELQSIVNYQTSGLDSKYFYDVNNGGLNYYWSAFLTDRSRYYSNPSYLRVGTDGSIESAMVDSSYRVRLVKTFR